MTDTDLIICNAAAAILEAQYGALMGSQDFYAASSASHAAFEIRHALRQIADAASEKAEVAS